MHMPQEQTQDHSDSGAIQMRGLLELSQSLSRMFVGWDLEMILRCVQQQWAVTTHACLDHVSVFAR